MVQRYPWMVQTNAGAMTSVARARALGPREHLTKERAALQQNGTQHCMNLGIDGYSMQVYAIWIVLHVPGVV